ncbi:radical SAM protein [Tunturiibacter empetritectus]|uniref:B12-binding domain-containing radical SAM protein n=1 Tax=Tunturiibacter empetritectus TaxID=3069691 RepID=UPI003D9B519A
MVDILLTHSYHLAYDQKQVRKMQPYRPLGTLYAAAALRDAGFSVALFDTMLSDPDMEFRRSLAHHDPKIVVIYEDDFNFLTKMCLTRMREVAWHLTDAAKEREIPVIAHGSDATDHPELFLSHGIDYVLRGEAEQTLVALCTDLIKGRTPTEIGGLVCIGDSGDATSGDRALSRNPDWTTLHQPPTDLTDFSSYRHAWKKAHGYFSVNMVSSRGCPYQCNWCAKPISGNKFQLRAASVVAEEMRQFKHEAGAEHIWFSDDVFALNRHWVQEFVSEVSQRAAALPFKIQSRADLMTEETVAALRSAGCAEVWMGVESGSQRILDAMDKGLNISSVRAARQRLKEFGIRAGYFLQFGYPGEHWSDLQETIAFVRNTRPDDIGISFSYPFLAPFSMSACGHNLGRNATGPIAMTCASCFKQSIRAGFIVLSAMLFTQKSTPGLSMVRASRWPRLPSNDCGTRYLFWSRLVKIQMQSNLSRRTRVGRLG